MSNEDISSTFELVAFDDAGSAHGPTTLPLYNTTNGTITVTADWVRQQAQKKQSFNQWAIQTHTLASFKNITRLLLPNMELTDSLLKKKMTILPKLLTYLDMRKNELGIKGILHLLSLTQEWPAKLFIKLDDNKGFQEAKLAEALQKHAYYFKKLNAFARLCYKVGPHA